MINRNLLAIGLTGPLVLAAGCSGGPAASGDGAPEGGGGSSGPALSTVLLLGDSVAAGQALPMAEAFGASGVEFTSIASDGGGNVVGPFSEKNWEELPDRIASAEADAVVYQITTYDWGTREEQREGYAKLADTVVDSGSDLFLVTMPPIEPDDFYAPHMEDLDRTAEVAGEVAESSDGVELLDAEEVWGEEFQRTREGEPDRSSDGIHTCPQGAARFTRWVLDELAGSYPGFAPADPEEWANTGWSGDERFSGC
ncbi:SGNH/GDSL hydrolase family protein [Nocardiopsis suaedae]|uniref:SGNH/GDSL hydrolase family protein n=1 Tax=Nocardiopsis suaedae TaxID=3018444 RepID=A0ABT4TF99_9ACTN|nr:SGNH/GDSL hydrolase family protein [Nocardiopsis suaedae]MDA2803377.1 SGNH/GDSL hydrolase family protein [Nocardiopsis suaedae]